MNGFARLGTYVMAPAAWALLTPIAVVFGDTSGLVWPALFALIGSALVTVAVRAVIKYGFDFEISLYTSPESAAVTVLTLILGPVMLLGGLLVAWVFWARVKLGEDTFAEASAGVLVGILVGGLGWIGFVALLFA
ncbi:hypothetical protein AB0N89_04420 [Amycolatopsis sp. NPDC089917]|uniref:hypothetical protein n=1 Tax=Amycolatopsis sp. NPDC089917 TaxID=3155187 RepID=UPI003447F209